MVISHSYVTLPEAIRIYPPKSLALTDGQVEAVETPGISALRDDTVWENDKDLMTTSP